MKVQLGWMLIAMIAFSAVFFLPTAEAQNACSYSIKAVNFPPTITEKTQFQVDVTVYANCPFPPPNYAGTFVSIRDLTTYDCTRFGSTTSGCSTPNSVDFTSGTRTFNGQIPWDHGFPAGSHTFKILVVNDLALSPDTEMAKRSLIKTINPMGGGKACVFCRNNVVLSVNVGHVGWGIPGSKPETWVFGSTEANYWIFNMDRAVIPSGDDNGAWDSTGDSETMLDTFKNHGYEEFKCEATKTSAELQHARK